MLRRSPFTRSYICKSWTSVETHSARASRSPIGAELCAGTSRTRPDGQFWQRAGGNRIHRLWKTTMSAKSRGSRRGAVGKDQEGELFGSKQLLRRMEEQPQYLLLVSFPIASGVGRCAGQTLPRPRLFLGSSQGSSASPLKDHHLEGW
jgi:hypothetical protein